MQLQLPPHSFWALLSPVLLEALRARPHLLEELLLQPRVFEVAPRARRHAQGEPPSARRFHAALGRLVEV